MKIFWDQWTINNFLKDPITLCDKHESDLQINPARQAF